MSVWHGRADSATGVATTSDARSGAATTAFRRNCLIPVDDEARDRLTGLLDRAGCDWTVERGQVRIDDAAATVLADDDGTAGWDVDHLLTSAEQVGGNPFGGHGRPGLDQYGIPGRSRGPVVLTVGPPRPTTDHRPRVVVLDTGLGEHPWFGQDDTEHRIVFADGTAAGPFHDDLDHPFAETTGTVPAPMLGALGSHVGHGTFIAGLVRQLCPEAIIAAPGVMGADGIVPESTLIEALEAVLRKQREEPGWAAAVVMSLGYYPENAEDLVYTSRLRAVLLDLGRRGVAVFCAAGNDGTRRPSFPAAFAVDPAWDDPAIAPLVSVAALNPDGSVADFSNDGPWVTAEAIGVSVVSTVPVIADGSARPARRVAGPAGRWRATADPDDFDSGFASWSGTSFAAPVVAARYLAALVEAGCPIDPTLRRSLITIGRTTESGPGRRVTVGAQ